MELNAHKVRQDEKKKLMGGAYEKSDLVFATAIGKPVDPKNLQDTHKKILKRAELPDVRFHELLGHSKISTTYDVYVKVTTETKAKAIKSLEKILTGNK